MSKINLSLQILLIILAVSLAWSSSLHKEFVGYDDIKLIARNPKINEPFWESAKFYVNIVSDSHNLAWTNYPTVVFRPLEWIASTLCYKIWGPRAFFYHLFVNFFLHILNSLILFFILRKLFPESSASFFTIMLWSVHPLHNEAINMLTSGLGFLLANFCALSSFLIYLYLDNLKTFRSKIFFLLAFLLSYVSYYGSEMLYFVPLFSLLFFRFKDLWKSISICFAFFFYLFHRFSIVTEYQEWLSPNLQEVLERIFVLAPQIFLHYLKLFFYPKILTMDQHHQVFLDNIWSFYHCLSLLIFLLFVGCTVYLSLRKKTYGIFAFFSFVAILISLNIIPLYTLARERYTYFFVFGLTAAFVFFALKNFKSKYLGIVFVLFFVSWTIRSIYRNADWKNGEIFWQSTIETCPDLGAKYNWKYRLLEYQRDPASKNFQIDSGLAQKNFEEFQNFPFTYWLSENSTIESYRNLEQKKHINFKYGYSGAKSIASALFFDASEKLKTGQISEGIRLLQLGHFYYPDHFQINLQYFVYTWGQDTRLSNYLFEKLWAQSKNNTFLARNFLDALLFVNHPRSFEIAEYFANKFYNTQSFYNFAFKSALQNKNYSKAYSIAKIIVKKYHTIKGIEEFIKEYEKSK